MDASMYKEMFEVQNYHWWFVAKKQIIMATVRQLTNENSGKKIEILDAGCGPGLMLNELQKVGTTSGMDFSDDAINFSRQHFEGVLKKCDLPSVVPFAKNSFDLLLALDVVEHIENDVGALEVFQRLLKSGGCGILTVPAFMFLWSEHDEINHHKRRYTLPEFKQKILAAGFEIEKISYYNTLLFPLVATVRFLNKLLKRKSDSDVELPGKMVNSILKRIFLLEKSLLKFFNLPFGVSLIAVVRKP